MATTLPGTEKRIAPLRGHRGAALPGQAVVVYDPDNALVLDMVAGEDAHQTERVLAGALLSRAEAGQVWVADRHFCTRTLLESWAAAGARFVVREHANHPRVAERGPWRDGGPAATGTVREQAIRVEGHAMPWRSAEPPAPTSSLPAPWQRQSWHLEGDGSQGATARNTTRLAPA